MSAAGGPNILWRTEHPRSWGNYGDRTGFKSEYFKLCMRGVWPKSAKLLESLTFNGQKIWLRLLILHFYGHYCHESSISMGQKLWWFHPSFHPSISFHIKAGQQEMIAKLALHRSLALSMGGFFSSSGNRENREMMMTFLATESGGTMFSEMFLRKDLSHRIRCNRIFCWRTWRLGEGIPRDFRSFGCFDIEECPSWTCTARRQGSLGMGTFCWWIQGLLHVIPTKKWQIKYYNKSRLQ